MMQPVRLHDALHVTATWHITMGHALVDDDVVKAEINGAVGCDAGANSGRPVAPAQLHAAE